MLAKKKVFLFVINYIITFSMSIKLHSLKDFLRQKSITHLPLTVVIGNEAGDADSIISSLCYAFYRQQSQKDEPKINYVPVVCVPKNDLAMRRETKLLLEKAGLQMSELITLEDINWIDFTSSKNCIVLTDHNVLSHKLSKYDDKVVEIVDHHMDMRKYPWVVGSQRNIAFDTTTGVATVGSACTLVVESFMSTPSLLNEEVATLLLGVILLDTINLDVTAHRATSRDCEAVSYLLKQFPMDKDEIFNLLKNAKTDPVFWQEMTADMALRLDYKCFPATIATTADAPINIGISSVLLPAVDFMGKSDLASSVSYYFNEGNDGIPVQLLVVMTLSLLPQPQRELVIFSPSLELIDRISSYLVSDCPDLLLELHGSSPEELIAPAYGLGISGVDKFWMVKGSQSNMKMSRKQVAPILIDYFRKEY